MVRFPCVCLVLAASTVATGCGGGHTATLTAPAPAPAPREEPAADRTVEVPQSKPEKKRRVRITQPSSGQTVAGRPIGQVGERIAKVAVRGLAEPGSQVFVAGNGDGGRGDDWVTVDASDGGHWRARVNVIGCGDEAASEPEITAGYDEPYADEDTVALRFICEDESAPAPTPQQQPAPRGSCDEIPARNFPVPPGDPRDGDGDGVACET